jgi:CBS domain containing-hemolysin-like protein
MPERTSVRANPLMRTFGLLFAPLVATLNRIALGLMRLLGIREPERGERLYSTQELTFLAEESEQGGQLGEQQRALIENIFALEERTASQLMTPRTRMMAINARARRDEIRALMARSAHSRFPVYGDNLDEILGVLHVKDFIRAETQGRFPDVTRLARPLPSVTESTTAEELLAVFRREHVHAALVVDEYGGTAGFVTLHDLIEDVVEDVVPDDSADVWARREPDGSVVARGDIPLEELRDEYGLPLTSEHAETVAGLLLEHLGRLPQPGETVTVSGHRLTAETMTGLAITRVRIVPDGD